MKLHFEFSVMAAVDHCRFSRLGYRSKMSFATVAFTLVELLVVIAIIGLLAAMLMPGLKGARESGRRVKCMSNLRQIYQALSLYGGDWNGYFPPYYQNAVSPYGALWSEQLYPYLNTDASHVLAKRSVFCCPSNPASTSGMDYGINFYVFGWYNVWNVPVNPSLAILAPSQTMLITDIDLGGASWPAAFIDTSYQHYRHGGGINTLFFDGHAAYLLRSAIPTSDNDPYWHGPPRVSP